MVGRGDQRAMGERGAGGTPPSRQAPTTAGRSRTGGSPTSIRQRRAKAGLFFTPRATCRTGDPAHLGPIGQDDCRKRLFFLSETALKTNNSDDRGWSGNSGPKGRIRPTQRTWRNPEECAAADTRRPKAQRVRRKLYSNGNGGRSDDERICGTSRSATKAAMNLKQTRLHAVGMYLAQRRGRRRRARRKQGVMGRRRVSKERLAKAIPPPPPHRDARGLHCGEHRFCGRGCAAMPRASFHHRAPPAILRRRAAGRDPGPFLKAARTFERDTPPGGVPRGRQGAVLNAEGFVPSLPSDNHIVAGASGRAREKFARRRPDLLLAEHGIYIPTDSNYPERAERGKGRRGCRTRATPYHEDGR